MFFGTSSQAFFHFCPSAVFDHGYNLVEMKSISFDLFQEFLNFLQVENIEGLDHSFFYIFQMFFRKHEYVFRVVLFEEKEQKFFPQFRHLCRLSAVFWSGYFFFSALPMWMFRFPFPSLMKYAEVFGLSEIQVFVPSYKCFIVSGQNDSLLPTYQGHLLRFYFIKFFDRRHFQVFPGFLHRLSYLCLFLVTGVLNSYWHWHQQCSFRLYILLQHESLVPKKHRKHLTTSTVPGILSILHYHSIFQKNDTKSC